MKRGLIDGRDNLILNDYRPVWLCDPQKNKFCDKKNCQQECFHTLDIGCARSSNTGELLPPDLSICRAGRSEIACGTITCYFISN